MDMPTENTILEGFDLDFLFDDGADTNDFISVGDQFPLLQDASLMDETRQTTNEVPGSEVESVGDKAREMQSQKNRRWKVGGRKVRALTVHSNEANNELDAGGKKRIAVSEDKRSKKRKTDRDYRARQKAIKQKNEEEVCTLRQENAELRLELEVFKQKADKVKGKSAEQINEDECEIVFELNYPDEAAKQRLMMIAAGFPGITSINMYTQRKRMTLEGINIDPLPLRDKLKNICSTKLVSFKVFQKKECEKKEERKQESEKFYMAYNPKPLHLNPKPLHLNPGFQGPPSLYADEFAEAYSATPVLRHRLENAMTVFLVIVLLLLLILPAGYNDVHFRFMNLFAVFFDAIGRGARRGQVFICDILNLLCN